MNLIRKFLFNFKNNYYTKLATCFFGIITTSLVLLLFIITFQKSEYRKMDRFAYNQNAFNQFCDVFEKNVLQNVFSVIQKDIFTITTYNKLTFDNLQNPFIYHDNPFETTLSYQKNLYNLHSKYPYITAINIYNYKEDTFISSTGGVYYNALARRDELPAIIDFNIFDKVNETQSSIFYEFADTANRNKLTVAQKLPLFSNGANLELLITVCLDLDRIYDSFFKAQLLEGSNFFVLSNTNQMIFSSNNQENFSDKQDLNEKIMSHFTLLEGKQDIAAGTNVYNLFWTTSQHNSWKYVYLSENQSTILMMGQTLGYLLLWFTVILLIGTVLTFVLSKSLYRPIRALLKYTNRTDSKNINELKEITETFSIMNNRLSNYETTIQNNSPLLLNNITYNVLTGNVVTIEELNSWLSMLNLYISEQSFFVFIVKFDPSIFQKLDQKEKNFILFSATPLVESQFENLDEQKRSILSEYNFSGQLTFLVNTNDFSREITKLPAILECLNFEFSNSCNIAVSNELTDLLDIEEAYKKTLSYFKYGFIYGNGNIFDEKLISTYDNKQGMYDTAFMKNLKHLLKENNFGALKTELKEFYILIKEKQYSYLYLHSISMQIIGIFSSEFEANNIPFTIGDSKSIADSFSKLTSIDACADWYGEIIDHLCDGMKEKSSGIDKDFMESILNYIHANFTDVSLNNTAIHFKISAGHLSRIFKKYVGTTFSDYVANLKLDYACTLLKTTNIKVAEIAEKLGYYNINYFNKIFKLKYNLTPLQYRKKQ